MKKIFWAIIISLIFLPVTPVMADSPTTDDISQQLICPCGCNEALSTCTCDTKKEIVASIEEKLTQGQSEEQVIRSFVDQYGEQMLVSSQTQVPVSSSPRSFNPMVWGLPFAGLLFGGGAVYIAFTKRNNRSQRPERRRQAKKRRV